MLQNATIYVGLFLYMYYVRMYAVYVLQFYF